MGMKFQCRYHLYCNWKMYWIQRLTFLNLILNLLFVSDTLICQWNYLFLQIFIIWPHPMHLSALLWCVKNGQLVDFFIIYSLIFSPTILSFLRRRWIINLNSRLYLFYALCSYGTVGLFYMSDNSEQGGADVSRCNLLCGEVSGRWTQPTSVDRCLL